MDILGLAPYLTVSTTSLIKLGKEHLGKFKKASIIANKNDYH
jgi:hypothetical protein